MSDDGRVVTAKLPDKLVKRMDEIADRIDRSKSWIVREAVSQWLVEEQRRYELTLEALKSIDEGRTISHEDIKDWAEQKKREKRKGGGMIIEWSADAQADLDRLYEFMARHDLDAADAVFDLLIAAPDALLDFPRMGSRLTEFEPREVREFRVDKYLLRYELTETAIRVARFFHAREDRF